MPISTPPSTNSPRRGDRWRGIGYQGPAKADIASILRTIEAKHGRDARIRYRGLLTAALRRIADDPGWCLDRRSQRNLRGIAKPPHTA